MKKDYYLWFVVLFILVCVCVLVYRSGCARIFIQPQPVYQIRQSVSAGNVEGLQALQTKTITPSLEDEMNRVLKRGLPPLRKNELPLPLREGAGVR